MRARLRFKHDINEKELISQMTDGFGRYVDAMDNFPTKIYPEQDGCTKEHPVLSWRGSGGLDGRAMTIIPGNDGLF